MKAISLFEYFFFGTAVRYLQDCITGTIIHDALDDGGWRVLSNIKEYGKKLSELNLQVTERASSKL
ncbi:MAG: hypothetical protein ABI986_10115, partial [Chloroflexota bacterium]